MRILAIETVDKTGSVAALDGEHVLIERDLGDRQRSLQTLVPAMSEILAEVGWQPRDVELIAVATGPGSFTGLRIGVATAKSFAYATGAQVSGVGTMSVLAAQVPVEHRRFATIVDAQREELFVAEFERGADGATICQSGPRIEAAAEWLLTLREGDVITGPGLKKWLPRVPAGVTAVTRELWQPRAETVGRLGLEAYLAGQREELLAIVPHYFRETAAEEQWRRKQSS
jgi:tRNA threonylcarbamoyladenosine biosynthesis protein TsaB